LTGPIPSEIGKCVSLQRLYLHDNELTGNIPAEIGNLVELTNLYFYGNQINGSIPVEIGKLTKLTHIWGFRNMLTGAIPDEIGNLTNLQVLHLYSNRLTGRIPNSIGKLLNLKSLYLHKNFLTGAPNSLSTLTAFKILFPNPMSSIPYDVFAQNPSAGLSPTNWTNLLDVPVLSKRQLTSALSMDGLIAMCPLNNVQDANVPAGCIAGIYNKYCLNLSDLGTCQSAYDTVVTASIFKPLSVCAAWNSGPRSLACAGAINNFKFTLPYMTLESSHASDFAKTIFGSQKYAPCMNTRVVKCIW